ncbi:hypothetical protein Tco_0809803 [Tanacetum coccineum]
MRNSSISIDPSLVYRRLTDKRFFLMITFRKAVLTSYLVDSYSGCSIGNDYSDGLIRANWSKLFFKINTFLPDIGEVLIHIFKSTQIVISFAMALNPAVFSPRPFEFLGSTLGQFSMETAPQSIGAKLFSGRDRYERDCQTMLSEGSPAKGFNCGMKHCCWLSGLLGMRWGSDSECNSSEVVLCCSLVHLLHWPFPLTSTIGEFSGESMEQVHEIAISGKCAWTICLRKTSSAHLSTFVIDCTHSHPYWVSERLTSSS